MRKKKKKISKYSEEFKWSVVQSVLSGKLSKEEARIAYGIKSNCAILYWMRKYSGNDDYRNTHTLTMSLPAMHDNKEYRELRDRIEQLEEELRRANLRADLWQKMIEVAEQQLKIEIRKKYGAQPSKSSGEATNPQG